MQPALNGLYILVPLPVGRLAPGDFRQEVRLLVFLLTGVAKGRQELSSGEKAAFLGIDQYILHLGDQQGKTPGSIGLNPAALGVGGALIAYGKTDAGGERLSA